MRRLLPGPIRPASALAWLVALATLAGCLGGGGDGDGGGTTPGTRSDSGISSTPAPPMPPPPGPTVVDLLTNFGLNGCRGITVEAWRSLPQIQAFLPAGFQAKPVEDLEGVGEGFGSLVIDLFACGNLTVADQARVPATYYGQVYTFIGPPTDRVPNTPNAPIHEYVFRVLAAEDILASLWPAAGYDTRSGPANVTIEGPGGLPLDQRGANAGIAGYLATGSGNRLNGAGIAAPFARYTALNDGSVLVWTGTYSFPGAYSGFGQFQVPADDPFAPMQAPDRFIGAMAYFYEDGAMQRMDLRRVFTPI